MPLHSNLGIGEIHIVHNYEYADTSARTGASGFVAADIGKIARQTDDNTFWVLTATAPTWVELTVVDHGRLTGLSDDDHDGVPWMPGRSGGQTISGGLDSGDDLKLHSTANATKGSIFFGDNSAYDEVNDRLGINKTAPTETLEVNGNTIISGSLQITGQILSGGLKVPNLTGTPANNQLAIWTDADTLEGDADLVFDGTNLGIGEPTPGYRLHIGASAGSGLFLDDSSISSASPAIRVLGKRNDNNTSQAFAGKLSLEHLNTANAQAANAPLGVIFFGANHTDGTEANIAYPASIAAVAEGSFTDINTMPTSITFRTGQTGRADYDTAGQDIGTLYMKLDSGGVLTTYGGAVFNESSADVDFRVESNGQTHMLFVSGNDDAVGIGTDTIETTAITEISSSTKGFILPRMTDTQKAAISTPAQGLLIWNNDSGSLCAFDGTNWKLFTVE